MGENTSRREPIGAADGSAAFASAAPPDAVPAGRDADLDGDDGLASAAWVARRGARSAVALTVRSLLVRALSFAGMLLLARLLAPADFGVYAMVAVFSTLFSMLGDFGLGASLVQQPAPPTKSQIATVWCAQQCTALAGIAILWLTAGLIASLAGLGSDSALMLRILSLGLLLESLGAVPEAMLARELRFGPVAAAEVLQQIVFFVVAVGLAASGFGSWAFVFGALAQLAVWAVVLNAAWPCWPGLHLERAELRRMLGFGLGFQVATVLAWLRDAPVPLVAGLIAGAAGAGYVQFALRLALTLATVDEIIARIAFPAFSRLDHSRHGRTVQLTIELTGLLLIPAQAWILVASPALVPALFGDAWAPAIVPLQLMCVATLFRYPARYLRQSAFAAGLSRRGVGIAASSCLLVLVPLAPAILTLGVAGAGWALLAGATLALAAACLVCREIGVRWAAYVALLAAGAAAAGAGLVVELVVGGTAGAVVAAPIVGGVFGLLAWIVDRPVIRTAVGLFRSMRTVDRTPETV